MNKKDYNPLKGNEVPETIWEKDQSTTAAGDPQNPALAKIKEIQLSDQQQIRELIRELEVTDPIVFLFDLAVWLEQLFIYDGNNKNIQAAITGLNKLIKVVFVQKTIKPISSRSFESVSTEIHKRLVQLLKSGLPSPIIRLCNLHHRIEIYNSFTQIDELDDHCEVKWYAQGCVRTTIKPGGFQGLQNYIRDDLKYNILTDYYYKRGMVIASEAYRRGSLIPQGDTIDDWTASLNHATLPIVAQAFLEHYGIEARFWLHGVQYDTSLLLQTLSLLMTQAQSKYAAYWEEIPGKSDVAKRIAQVWQAYLAAGGQQIPGPLFVDTWSNLVDRAYEVLAAGNWTRDEVERHLAFFSACLDSDLKYLDIQETPILRSGDFVIYFARPLAIQNPWIPILHPLIKAVSGKQPQGANKRVSRSTRHLGQQFRQHGFEVLIDQDLVKPDSAGKKVTDVDILALKDNQLFIIQVKMTYPRATMKEASIHRNTALQKAGEQTEKSIRFLKQHWTDFRPKLKTELEWEALQVTPLVVSTSFECDRERFSGHLKISQFELERYLENDAFLCFAPEEEALKSEFYDYEQYLFYPAEEKLSGGHLNALIETNALWRFIEPMVAATPIDDFLPGFCLSDTPAAQADAYFTQGDASFNQGAMEEAAALYRRAIGLFPDNEAYYKGLGNALASMGKCQESLDNFDRAIAINPYFGEAYNARGLTYAELGQFDKAEADLRKAIQYAPYDISAWHHLALMQLNRGHEWRAAELIREGMRYAAKGLQLFSLLTSEEQTKYHKSATVLTAILARH